MKHLVEGQDKNLFQELVKTIGLQADTNESILHTHYQAREHRKTRKLSSTVLLRVENQKSNLHYTRRITPKRVTSCGAHLRGLAPGQHSSEERRNGGESLATLCRFDRLGNRTQTSRTDSVRLATELTAGKSSLYSPYYAEACNE